MNYSFSLDVSIVSEIPVLQSHCKILQRDTPKCL